jgi:apolipoprotein N-acyltransferase
MRVDEPQVVDRQRRAVVVLKALVSLKALVALKALVPLKALIPLKALATLKALIPLKALAVRIRQYPYLGDIAALVAGGLLPLSLSPFGFWPAGILSLVVLMGLVDTCSVMRGAIRFYCFSVGMYGVGVSWIYVSIHEYGNASVLLAGFLVLVFVLAFSVFSFVHGYLYLRYVRSAPLGMTVGFPLLWFIREWVFTWILTGFPWLFVGYGYLDTALAGYIPVVGVSGLGLLVLLQAAMIKKMLDRVSTWVRFGIATGIVGIWIGGLALAEVRFVEPVGRSISVSAVQGNIPQDIKWQSDSVGFIIREYVDLTSTEWGRDLIVWPEAAVPLFRESALPWLQRWDRQGKATGSALLLGIPDREPGSDDFWNAAIVLGDGDGRYIKRRLVPFGEYVPLEGLLRGTIAFFDLPMANNQPGPWEQAPLRAGDLSLSLSICYEVVYSELVRQTVVNPDLLVTISNDTWFGDSIGPWQHLEMARARALENGRYMLRATNNGISALIDERGVIRSRLPQFESGVLRGEVALLSGRTPFAAVGNLPTLTLVGLLLSVLLLAPQLRRRRRPG